MKVSGLDVHKDSIFCAIYNGKEYSEVNEYETTTAKIRQMGEYLRSEGVKKVAMESTSTYWVPVWDILLEMGFDLMLVNPFLIKQMPGRKSDVKDAQWISVKKRIEDKKKLRVTNLKCTLFFWVRQIIIPEMYQQVLGKIPYPIPIS